MRTLNLRPLILPLLIAAVAACSGNAGVSSSLTPLGPSGLTTISTAGSASLTGTLVETGQAQPQSTGLRMLDMGATVTVSITGTGLAQDVPAGGTFVFDDVPTGPIELHFSGRGVDARATVTVGADEAVTIVVTLGGPAADLHVTDRRRKPKAELEGLVTAVDPVALTFVVEGRTVAVTETTVIRHGNRHYTFADIVVGQQAHVRGTPDAVTGVVTATEVKLQPGPGVSDDDEDDESESDALDDDDEDEDEEDDDRDEDGRRLKLEGLVSGLTGACPALEFTVEGTLVTTDAATRFDDGVCEDLADGVEVEVRGALALDGTVTATRVEIESEDD